MGAKNRPKSDPKRVQNQDVFQERKKSSSRASWSRLGPILEHFEGHLGVIKSVFVLETMIFGEFLRF